jgi:hypothetical protein
MALRLLRGWGWLAIDYKIQVPNEEAGTYHRRGFIEFVARRCRIIF